VRAIVQRVTRARCRVGDELTGEIGPGLVVLIGSTHGDGEGDALWMAGKIAGLRIFADDEGKMNRDVREVGGAALAISQFTVYADARRGRRPDFVAAAPPEHAEPLYERFCERLEAEGVRVARGRFRTHMQIELENDGPVTLVIDSPTAAPPAASRA